MDAHQIQAAFPHLTIQSDVILAPFTYMKVGGPAALFVEVKRSEDLFALCSYCFQHALPFVILGGVSNSVIPDEGLDKLVIRNGTSAIELGNADGEKQIVTAESGVVTATLAHETARAGLTGLEVFVGVPGTVGGAVKNNSHFTAYDLFGNFITSVQVCTVEGKRETWPKEKLQFAYDYSIFHTQNDVILSATFELYKGDTVHIQEKIRAAALKRTTTQPIGIPSTGCMFKNPKVSNAQLNAIGAQVEIPESALKHLSDDTTQIAAGFLIDRAGLKGKTIGGAQVSDKHATYIINLADATAADVEALATFVEATTKEKFGVALEREVFFL